MRADYPDDWKSANVYLIADLHIGDPASDTRLIARRINQIANDPCGLVILNGDILNTALRNGVSDVYGEVSPPMQQIDEACALLTPIKDRVIGATTGNHEARTYKSDGVDMMRLVCRQLGFEGNYSPEGVLIFLRFGRRGGNSRHAGQNNAQWYSIYSTHGSGGGRKEGAKAIRLADMAAIVDADIYCHAHTHLPMIMKQSFFRASSHTCSVQLVEKLFVNSGATLDYGGYGQSYEFKPASKGNPIIHLDAREKHATATL